VVCKRVRRGEITVREGDRVVALLGRVPVRRHRHGDVLVPAVAIAHNTRHALYDCLYLALAVILDAPLVTADARLFRALRITGARQHVVWVDDL